METVGIAAWCDEESLWYARCDGTGTACGRMWLDGRREERWRGVAFIGDEVGRAEVTILLGVQLHGEPVLARGLDKIRLQAQIVVRERPRTSDHAGDHLDGVVRGVGS